MNHSEYFNEVLWQLFALLKVAWQFQAAPETTARKRRRLAKRIDKFLSMLALLAPNVYPFVNQPQQSGRGAIWVRLRCDNHSFARIALPEDYSLGLPKK